VKNTHDFYQNIIDNSPDFVFESRVDNFKFTRVNNRACEFYGYSITEFMNMNIFDIEVSPPLKEQVRILYDNTPLGRVVEVYGYNKKKDGTTFPVHVRFSKINKEFAIANVRDITQQRNNEKAIENVNINLKKSQKLLQKANKDLEIRVLERTKSLNKANEKLKKEVEEKDQILNHVQKFSSAVEQTADNIMITKFDGTIEYVNPAFELLTGHVLKKISGKTPRILKSGAHDNSFYEELWETILSGRVFRAVFINSKSNGDLFSEEKTITPILNKADEITHFVSTGRDVSDRVKSEEKLAKSKDQLRALASRLESIREEERINISRKIHDELGHSLTGIQFDIESLRKNPELQNKKVSHELNAINKLVYQSLETLKDIATELRPGVLDTLGLDAAIDWQLSQFRTRTKIKCKQNIEDLPSEISNTISTTIFRTFQEILTNIIRHSQANKVMVILKIDHNDIVLNVRDNGIGIKEGDLGNINSLGLLGMQERVNMVGGSFNIARVKKGGTEVKISIPV